MNFKLPPQTGRWIALILGAAAIAVLVAGKSGLYNLYRTTAETHRMQKEIVQLNHTVDSMNVVIERLKNDSTYIERIAREKLGMAKKTEKVYKFIGP